MEAPGQHFGKSDLERMGVFIEMEYLNPKLKPNLPDANAVIKGRQMYPGYPKSKEDGYFQEKFVRVFEKEALSNAFKRDLQAAMKSKLKNRTPAGFTPASFSQKHSTPGDYFGTFGPKLPAFREKAKPRVIAPKEPPNIRGNPGKKGGPGYADITISKYPEHMKDFYDEVKVRGRKKYAEHMKGVRAGPLLSMVCPQPFFDKNPYHTAKPAPYYRIPPLPKATTGTARFLPSSPAKSGHDGGINPYPRAEKLPKAKPAPRKDFEKKIFYPQMRLKPTPTKSIVNHNIDISVNATNWQTFKPIVYPASTVNGKLLR